VLTEKFGQERGAFRLGRLTVQLPLELSDALARMAQRPQLLQLSDDLLHFDVNHADPPSASAETKI
jgi:hypothetical protein